jgi:hypothetical protein
MWRTVSKCLLMFLTVAGSVLGESDATDRAAVRECLARLEHGTWGVEDQESIRRIVPLASVVALDELISQVQSNRQVSLALPKLIFDEMHVTNKVEVLAARVREVQDVMAKQRLLFFLSLFRGEAVWLTLVENLSDKRVYQTQRSPEARGPARRLCDEALLCLLNNLQVFWFSVNWKKRVERLANFGG